MVIVLQSQGPKTAVHEALLADDPAEVTEAKHHPTHTPITPLGIDMPYCVDGSELD